jgi:long-chain acyl-CoA synthetase
VKVGSIGPKAQGWDVRIFDENSSKELGVDEIGEIVVKGQGLFKGYWEKPEETKKAFDENGWFRTGDLGRCDQDGFFFIVDRLKDMILCGGYNVYPREIEEVLYTHPKILEVAVIGIKDPDRGEVPAAFITLKQGETTEPDEIKAYCKQNMAFYKLPQRVDIVPELPKNATGKILKRVIRDEWIK